MNSEGICDDLKLRRWPSKQISYTHILHSSFAEGDAFAGPASCPPAHAPARGYQQTEDRADVPPAPTNAQ